MRIRESGALQETHDKHGFLSFQHNLDLPILRPNATKKGTEKVNQGNQTSLCIFSKLQLSGKGKQH